VRVHWYWPFARPEELDWAVGTARNDDEIVVQVIDRPAAPAAGRAGPVTIVRDLPDVNRNTTNRIEWVASRARTYRRRASRRRSLWRTHQFDLVHLHYANRFTDGFVRPPGPWVLSVHDVVPHEPRLGTLVERQLLRLLYRRPDALVVHHQRLADVLMSDFAVGSDRVHVVPHQVFPVPGRPGPRPDGVPMVLFFGALRANKGLEVLAQAVELLDPDLVRFHIAGRGDSATEQAVRRLAERHRHVDVELGHATLDRKRALFRDASIVVLPYRTFASQSGVLHDAYGHGRPVVVTDVGALGETVREDRTGLVVGAGDPTALAGAIADLATTDRWAELSRAGLRIAAERSPEASGRLLRAVYDQVVH